MLRRQEDTWERVTSKWVMRIDRMLGYHNITISADVSIWEWSRVRFLTNLASSDSKVFLTARTDGTGKLLLQCPSRTLSIYAHDNCVKSSGSCWPASANFITFPGALRSVELRRVLQGAQSSRSQINCRSGCWPIAAGDDFACTTRRFLQDGMQRGLAEK